jgi:hypothetical protein
VLLAAVELMKNQQWRSPMPVKRKLRYPGDGGNPIIQDNEVLRVTFFDSRPAPTSFHDGKGHAVGNRPGFLFQHDGLLSEAADAVRQSMYETYDAEVSSAYLGNPPTGAGSRGPIGQRAGDACDLNGERGHLEVDPQTGDFVCVVDANRNTDGLTLDQLRTDHENTMRLEYARHEDWLRSAYKGR